MPLILPGNVGSATASTSYNVSNSIRLNDGDSPRLRNAFGTPTNRKKYTFSAWMKKGKVGNTSGGTEDTLWGVYTDGSNYSYLRINTGPQFEWKIREGGSTVGKIQTNALIRDPSAWLHIVVAYDSTQGTAANRMKMYINGTQVSSFNTETYVNQNVETTFNESGQNLDIGSDGNGAGYFDGYMAEVVFIDGQQLAADQFGEFDSDSPTIWKPIDVSGLTFGDNGSYLDFEDSSALGNDVSGNNRDFASTNLAATDQSIDTCTNNFATLNPLIYESRDNTFAEGNLKITGGGSDSWTTHYGLSTIAVSTGKWFVESKVTTVQASQAILGLISTTEAIGSSLKDEGVLAVEKSGRITGGGNNIETGLTAFSNGDIAGLAFDATNGTGQFYRNGSAYGSAVSSIASDTYYFATTTYNAGGVVEFNFGSPPYSESGGNSDGNGYGNFSMAVPSGYFALNTKNLAEYGG